MALKPLHLVLLISLAGCQDWDCWFDLAAAETSRTLFLARDCGQKGGADVRTFDLDDVTAPSVKISSETPSRIAVSAKERHVAVTARSNHRVMVFYVEGRSRTNLSARYSSNLGKVVLVPDGQGIWTTLWGHPDSGVLLLDTLGTDHRAFVPLAGDPVAIAYLPAEKTVVAASSDAGNVVKIDAVRFSEIATTTTSGALDFAILDQPPRIALLEDRSQRVMVRDLSTLAEIRELTTGAEPRRIAASPDGQLFAVTERADPAVRIFDAATLTERAVYPMTSAPDALLITADGRAFVGLGLEGAIEVIELANGESVGRIQF